MRTLTTSVWGLLEAKSRAVQPSCEDKVVIECYNVIQETKQLLTIVIERIPLHLLCVCVLMYTGLLSLIKIISNVMMIESFLANSICTHSYNHSLNSVYN